MFIYKSFSEARDKAFTKASLRFVASITSRSFFLLIMRVVE